MSYTVHIEQFEGPLSLLLELIENNELAITDVSLGGITEAYLAHLEQVEELVPHELADFLLVAGRLLYLKSKLLLPELVVEEEEDMDLATQLKLYQRFAEAAAWLTERLASDKVAYFGKALALDVPSFSPPSSLQAEDLAAALRGLVEQARPYVDLPQQLIERTVTVEEKIAHLKERIQQQAQLFFHDIAKRGSRTDVVASFLALLELFKQSVVDVHQEGQFSDIAITRSSLST